MQHDGNAREITRWIHSLLSPDTVQDANWKYGATGNGSNHGGRAITAVRRFIDAKRNIIDSLPVGRIFVWSNSLYDERLFDNPDLPDAFDAAITSHYDHSSLWSMPRQKLSRTMTYTPRVENSCNIKAVIYLDGVCAIYINLKPEYYRKMRNQWR